MVRYNIVPAAGLATRFLPASKSIPKEMFPVYDKPAVQYIIEEATKAGVEKTVFVTGEGKECILDHFDRINPKFPLTKLNETLQNSVKSLESLTDVVSVRQKQPKGLGHAVLTGCKIINNSSFAVTLPDVLVHSLHGPSCMEKMVEIHEAENASVIALMRVPDEDRGKYGIVEGVVKESVIEIESLVEKPGIDGTQSNLAIVGRYIFTPAVVELLEDTKPGKNGEIQLTDAINKLSKKEKVYGVILDESDLVFDTGDREGYALATAFFTSIQTDSFKEKLLKILEI
jgi:UTP--glucose-1-phosphate uridylyltransferase